MASTEEQADFVARAAAAFETAELKGGEFYNAVMDLVPLMREGRALGIAGYLQSSRMKNDLRHTAGKVAGALADVFAIHREGTDLAQKLGIDLPQPTDGGGGR